MGHPAHSSGAESRGAFVGAGFYHRAPTCSATEGYPAPAGSRPARDPPRAHSCRLPLKSPHKRRSRALPPTPLHPLSSYLTTSEPPYPSGRAAAGACKRRDGLYDAAHFTLLIRCWYPFGDHPASTLSGAIPTQRHLVARLSPPTNCCTSTAQLNQHLAQFLLSRLLAELYSSLTSSLESVSAHRRPVIDLPSPYQQPQNLTVIITIGTMASTIHVANETRSSSSRMTRENKKITYQMHVIQQPERARACGSGAKSSADRRPVDPPPIVELRVFEGEHDITFSYNANFFLFATLENARTMAQGRVAAAQTVIPVLTGTPVAGMAYLDRPQPAGYFIFPDLSVRHEGKYRLSFALYEEIKAEKDRDPENPQSADPLFPHNGAHVSHRLEVKSAPFTVFSAKKFPGLTESTALSRMVAEQGCRVRIRRDVRMRRRDNKGANYSDEYEEEANYERPRQSATPDVYKQSPVLTPHGSMNGDDRPRSVSNASNHGFNMPPERRTSVQDLAPQYNPQAYPPHIAPQTPNYAPQVQYASAQTQQYSNGYAQPQQSMMPPQAPYQHAQQTYPTQPPQQMQQSYGYMPSQQYPQPHYPEAGHHIRHNSMEQSTAPQYRNPPVQPTQPPQYPTYNPNMAPYGSMDASYNRPQQMNPPAMSAPPQIPTSISTSVTPNGQVLAPLKTEVGMMNKYDAMSPYPLSGSNSTVSESISQDHYRTPITAPPRIESQSQPSGATKRAYSDTFDTQHIEQPLRHGARPDNTHHADYQIPQFDSAEEDELETAAAMAAMSYRRADGSHRRRQVPVNQ